MQPSMGTTMEGGIPVTDRMNLFTAINHAMGHGPRNGPIGRRLW